MKSILNIVQIWYNELLTIIKDPGIMIFILFVPLAYPLLYSYVYTNEVVREVPVAVVDECGNALSRELLRKIEATPDVDIVAHCNNMTEAQKICTMESRHISGCIAIWEVCCITKRYFLRLQMCRLK